jgi:GNAT superfamily N-acetyltransferase
MARIWETPASAMGGRRVRWDDAWAADSGLPSRMFNRAIIIRRLDPSSAAELAERILRFYGSRPDGGPYLVVDTWATLDLEPYGFKRWLTLPFMIRAPGGTPETRPDLEIRPVQSKSDMAMFVRALVEGFAISELTNLPPSRIMDERVLADGAMRCWIAFRDGQPIGTSVAYVSDGIVGVYLVSVVPSARRQGLGEALTWHAALADSAAPSTLQASTLGRPVYERMGYLTALECQTWIKTAR